MVRFAALILALALLAPATADDRWPRVERAKAVAINYWGQPAQCPHVWAMRADTLTNPGAAAEAGGCSIYFLRGWWALSPRASFARFCSVYLHEWGHLLGQSHSDDPESVMHSPVPTIRACR